ncbi:MAG: tetratricopeptide repeat protein [Candidatus Hydrogenedentes bacterium]|nr:tetratricopeptide repeat protein [Candidatus Hydrogenedentota bacterium]
MGHEMTSQRKASIREVKMGTACYNARDYVGAEKYFRRALEQDPGYARAHYSLANTLHKLGAPEEAYEEWSKAVIVEPDSDTAEKAREKLASVGRQLRNTSQGLLDGLGSAR